ncbi:regulating synaptic membrane exocytosis protein 2-like [Sardina pilchardus]|uniref:regulating synaptic membrane exocytosis protein 2-like n=1 Tax=Sardina pilchardus TaxID=27697 RepID=UPI002E0EE593
MSAPLGPRGGPSAPPAAAALPEMPDLSHLTEEERKIILGVMDRQKKEEEKEQSMLKVKEEPKPQPAQWFPFSGITDLVNNVLQPQQKSPNEKEPEPKLHQQFEMYKDQVKKMGEEAPVTQELKPDAPTCGICHKTKFADGCGHLCSYCQSKFCARCGGRVSLRSNKVMWVCNLCRKQQEILTKSGAWFYSGSGATLPAGLGGGEGARGLARRRHEEAPQEKKAKLQEAPLHYQGPPGLPRQHSLGEVPSDSVFAALLVGAGQTAVTGNRWPSFSAGTRAPPVGRHVSTTDGATSPPVAPASPRPAPRAAVTFLRRAKETEETEEERCFASPPPAVGLAVNC